MPALLVLTYTLSRAVLEQVEPGTGLALACALAPALVLGALLVWFVRAIRGLDELGQRIQLEALAWAFPTALFVVLAAGLLELAGYPGIGNWDLPRLWPLLIVPYWMGLAVATRRYA
jgi:hypothetical protein